MRRFACALFRYSEALIGLGLILVTVLYAARFYDLSTPPFEDAAMLMRYAAHLARGYGIVWNIGELPVDGATDFLFMVLAAGLIKLGLGVGRAVRTLAFLSHLLTVWLIYWGNRRLWNAPRAAAAFSALYLAFGTGLAYVMAFFGTPTFALSAALTWFLALRLMETESPSPRQSLGFALSGLVMGLIRPEGTILAVLMLLAIVLYRRGRQVRSVILIFALVFLVLGGAYFLWRWDYFGHPLPNPFYKKGGGVLHIGAWKASLLNFLRLSAPFALAFVLGWHSSASARRTLAYLIPLLGFASAFILISDEMNYGARFQYPLLPLVLLSWWPLVREFPRAALVTRGERISGALALGAAALGMLVYSGAQNCFLVSEQKACFVAYERDGRAELGQLLSAYRDKGYILATSEAGLLPYYSGWRTIDTWGLNDPWIAQNGGITTEYLDRYKPHLIVFHDFYSPLVPPKLTESNLAQSWFHMTITLKTYAESHGYILAAAFGDSPYRAHYYYVRPDFEDSQRLVRQIAEFRYYWYVTGKKAINYARYLTPQP